MASPLPPDSAGYNPLIPNENSGTNDNESEDPNTTTTTTTTIAHDTISLGTFEFVPLPGFQQAIDDPAFSLERCLDVLTTIISCDLVWSDELQDTCVDEQLPALALAAARSPHVRQEIDGDPYVDVALTLVVPSDYNKQDLVHLLNPLPAEILVAAVQPDVDRGFFWREMERAFVDNGHKPLNEQDVLRILQSNSVRAVSTVPTTTTFFNCSRKL